MQLSLYQGATQEIEDLVGGFLGLVHVVVVILKQTVLGEHLVVVLPTDVEVTLAGTTETTAAIGIADYAREAAGRGGLGVVAPVGGIHPAVTIVHDAGEYLGHTHSSGL